jgi:hypothetical protein
MAREFDPEQYPEHTVRSLAPEPKVVAGTLAGALVVLVAYVADLAGLVLPPAVTAALATLLAIGAAYLRSNGDRGR